MQFRHPESYRILSDDRILQDPMESGVGYVDLGLDSPEKSIFEFRLETLPRERSQWA
jgi:hypothetical protein